MKCFIDGNTLCIVSNDFVDLQVSSGVLFIDLTKDQLSTIKLLEKRDKKPGGIIN